MKLRMTSAVIFSALALGAVACSSAGGTASGTDDLNGNPVCDPLKCPDGEHFSQKKCECVDNCKQIDIVACAPGSHWDIDTCQCVPDVVCDPLKCASGEHWSSTQCECVATCTEMWMCIQGEHWDADACKCVADVSPASK